MSKEQQVILNIKGKDITFEPNEVAYNKFINEMSMDNKVAPAHSYLTRVVIQADKEALAEILRLPGAALQIVNEVNKEYAPQLEIFVKK